MVIQTHYINGKQVNLPRNWQDLGFKANLRQDLDNEFMLNITEFEWDRAEMRLLKSLRKQSYQGIPHQIDLYDERTGANATIFEGFINLTTATFDLETVTAQSQYRLTLDWLGEVANGVDFQFLYEKGFLKPSDIVFVPYLVNVTDYGNLLLISVSSIYIINEISLVISKFAPENGALIATLIESITGIVQLIFTIIYFVILLVAVTNLILDILAYFIQKVKYKPGMYALKLCEAGANYFGFKFESTTLSGSTYQNMVITPETFVNPEDESGLRGFFNRNPNLQIGYPLMNYGEFLEELKKLFNGRFIFTNGNLLKFEPKVRQAFNPRFKVPNLDQYQERTNLSSIPSNFLFSFAYDVKDENTITNWRGNNARAVMAQKALPDRQLNLLSGFESVQSRFARGVQKRELNVVERISLGFLEVTDSILGGAVKVLNSAIGVINGALRVIERIRKALRVVGIKTKKPISTVDKVEAPNFANLITNRIGNLETTDDITTVPKVLMINPNDQRLTNDNDRLINAKYIVEKFYLPFIFRQGLIKTYNDVGMSFNQYLQVVEDLSVQDIDGNVGEFEEIEYNPETQLAQLRIFVPQQVDENVEINIIEPTGL